MLKFGNKEFRNLQEQVEENMNDILKLKNGQAVLDEFGIKVVGQVDSSAEMPTVAEYKEDNPSWAYGDAFAVGTEAPYDLKILTRANEAHSSDYWFDIGEFPAPGPQGEQGPKGLDYWAHSIDYNTNIAPTLEYLIEDNIYSASDDRAPVVGDIIWGLWKVYPNGYGSGYTDTYIVILKITNVNTTALRYDAMVVDYMKTNGPQGKIALEYKQIISSENAPSYYASGAHTLQLSMSGGNTLFNRMPEAHESFLAVYQKTGDDGGSYFANVVIDSISTVSSTTTFNCHIESYSVAPGGEQGPAGQDGQDGEVLAATEIFEYAAHPQLGGSTPPYYYYTAPTGFFSKEPEDDENFQFIFECTLDNLVYLCNGRIISAANNTFRIIDFVQVTGEDALTYNTVINSSAQYEPQQNQIISNLPIVNCNRTPVVNDPLVVLIKWQGKAYLAVATVESIESSEENFSIRIKSAINTSSIQVQADWTEADSSAVDYIKNKPILATVATTGDYDDLIDKPTIPDAVSGVNDGTNWTSITIGDTTKAIPQGGKPSINDFTAGPGIVIDEDLTHDTVSIEVDQSSIPFKVDLASVAFSGDYDDLIDKPSIPAAQVQSDYAQSNSAAIDYIKNKPDLSIYAQSSSLATVATSGDYDDLLDKPDLSIYAQSSSLATVATTGDYDDLLNKPTIPAAQVNSDWNAASGVAQILNKPSLATVATSGSYNDLTDKPSIPAAQVNSDWNASSGVAQILNKPTIPDTTYMVTTNTSQEITADKQFSGSVDIDEDFGVAANVRFGADTNNCMAINGDDGSIVHVTADTQQGSYSSSETAIANFHKNYDNTTGYYDYIVMSSSNSGAEIGIAGSDLEGEPRDITFNIYNGTLSVDNLTDGITTKTMTEVLAGGAQVQADWTESDSADPSYIKNKPTIPAAQVNSDWNAVSGVAQILNKPTIPDTTYMVTTNTAQEITGGKQFSGTITLDPEGMDVDVNTTFGSSSDNLLGVSNDGFIHFTEDTQQGASGSTDTGIVNLHKNYDGTTGYYDYMNMSSDSTGLEIGIASTDLEGEPRPVTVGLYNATLTDGTNSMTLANIAAKSTVSGTNDGTNWTDITIDGVTKAIPAGGGGSSITITTTTGSESISDGTNTLNVMTRNTSQVITASKEFRSNAGIYISPAGSGSSWTRFYHEGGQSTFKNGADNSSVYTPSGYYFNTQSWAGSDMGAYQMYCSDSSSSPNYFAPAGFANRNYNLGTSNYKWNNIYLKGSLYGTSGNITVNDLIARNPAPTTTDGTYVLECTVSSGVPTYSWVLKA